MTDDHAKQLADLIEAAHFAPNDDAYLAIVVDNLLALREGQQRQTALLSALAVTGNSAEYFQGHGVIGQAIALGETVVAAGLGGWHGAEGRGSGRGQRVRRCRSEPRGLSAKCCFQRRGVSRWTSRAGWRSMRCRASTR